MTRRPIGSRPGRWSSLCLLLTLLAATAEAQETRPRILLVNDDGIESEGIATMAAALRAFADVVVVAPDGNRSGSSQSSTIRRIRAEVKPVYRDGELFGYGLNATPADAAEFGLLHFGVERPFDLVVSGINAGANTGDVAHSSGTVGAALEAVGYGVPAVATSQGGGQDYGLTARITVDIVRRVLRDGLPPGVVLSLNVPGGELRGIVSRRMGGTYFGVEAFEEIASSPDSTSYRARQRGAVLGGDDTDTAAYMDGYATITPIRFDWTDEETLRTLGGWNLTLDP